MKLLCACFIIATLAASESDALKLAVATDQMASSDLGSKSAINGTLCDKDPSFHPEMDICCDGMIYPISDSTAGRRLRRPAKTCGAAVRLLSTTPLWSVVVRISRT